MYCNLTEITNEGKRIIPSSTGGTVFDSTLDAVKHLDKVRPNWKEDYKNRYFVRCTSVNGHPIVFDSWDPKEKE